MIFSEIYSAYYNSVAEILSLAINGITDEKILREAVSKYAFSESVLTILPSIKSEKWQILRSDMSTPIKHIPSMPLTLLEKRWLKSISFDPRIRLFDIDFNGLDGIDPLFTSEDYIIYDKYSDSDPYFDEGYISRFRVILRAIREKRNVKIEMINRKGRLLSMDILPLKLEYSEKDDKFRLISSGCRYSGTVNLARIINCELSDKSTHPSHVFHKKQSKTVTVMINDERNALERCMLHFAHFEKQAEKIDKIHYRVNIRYDKEDETEMVIRVLSFGPFIEVTEPPSFRKLITERLLKQKSCEL